MGVTYSGTDAALTVNQQGTGKLFEVQDGGVARVTVLDGGNVGIGTTQPLQALHVLANARVDGNATLGDSVTADAHTVSGSVGVTYSGTDAALTVNQQGTGKLFEVQDGGVARVTVLDGGNVGIGLTNPLQKLHVVGNTRIQGDAIVTGNWEVQGTTTYIDTYTAVTSNVTINNASGNGPALRVTQSGVGANYPIADFYDSDVSTTVPALRIADGGNVGIGTTDPLQKLHVVGNVQATTFSGALSGNASTATKWETTRTIALAGNVTATAANIDGSGNVSLTTTVASDVITNAMVNSAAAIADTKLATISTAGKVSNGATTATDANTAGAIVARDASGNFASGQITAKRVIPYSGMANSDYWGAAIEVRELNLGGAQTGVRSEAPRIGFHWANRVGSQIMMEVNGQIAVVNNTGTAYGTFAAGATTITGTTPFSSMTTNPIGASVTIATTTGGQKLHLGAYYTGLVGSGSAIQSSDFFNNVDNGGPLILNPLGGNVGIGTTAPQATLHVVGSIIANGSAAPAEYIPTAISNYEEYTFTGYLGYSLAPGASIGSGASYSPTIKVARINKLITMYISSFQVYVVGTAYFFQITNVPSRFKPPAVYHEFLVRSYDNGRRTSLLTISPSDGAINWYFGTSFESYPGGSGTQFAYLPASISYIL
jgi:hypothetical protein